MAHYYKTFDENRSGLGPLYSDSSLFSFEGQEVQVTCRLIIQMWQAELMLHWCGLLGATFRALQGPLCKFVVKSPSWRQQSRLNFPPNGGWIASALVMSEGAFCPSKITFPAGGQQYRAEAHFASLSKMSTPHFFHWCAAIDVRRHHGLCHRTAFGETLISKDMILKELACSRKS